MSTNKPKIKIVNVDLEAQFDDNELLPMPLKENYENHPEIPFVNKITAGDYNAIVKNVTSINEIEKNISKDVKETLDKTNVLEVQLTKFYESIQYMPFTRGNVVNDSGVYKIQMPKNAKLNDLIRNIYNSSEISSIYMGRFTLTARNDRNLDWGWPPSIWNITTTVLPQMFAQNYKETIDGKYYIYYSLISEPFPATAYKKYPIPFVLTLENNPNDLTTVLYFQHKVLATNGEGAATTGGFYRNQNAQPADFKEANVWIAQKQAIDLSGIS